MSHGIAQDSTFAARRVFLQLDWLGVLGETTIVSEEPIDRLCRLSRPRYRRAPILEADGSGAGWLHLVAAAPDTVESRSPMAPTE